MVTVEAGILKDVLNAIKSISEKLFNYLGASDIEKSHTTIDEKSVKKKSNGVYTFKASYVEQANKSAPVPYTLTVQLAEGDDKSTLKNNSAIIPKMEVTANLNDVTVKETATNVKVKDMWATAEKLLLSGLDDDTKLAFGIKSSKSMQVTLQRITAAKESCINLTAIKADYNLAEAYTNLDVVLDSPEFTDMITEEPISFEIVDTGDDYDISTIDSISDATVYSLKNLLCATVQFSMDIQLLRWESARCFDIFNRIGSQLWSVHDWIDKLGIWIIEASNSVYNVLGDCIPDLGETVDVCCEHSPCLEYTGEQIIYPVFDRMISAIENNLPNLPSDMQVSLNYWLRDLKQFVNFEIKQR